MEIHVRFSKYSFERCKGSCEIKWLQMFCQFSRKSNENEEKHGQNWAPICQWWVSKMQLVNRVRTGLLIVPLSINSGNRDRPVIRIYSSKLWNVVSRLKYRNISNLVKMAHCIHFCIISRYFKVANLLGVCGRNLFNDQITSPLTRFY